MESKNLIIERIVSVVNKTSPQSQVFLYGSRARGNAKNSSDWDILILMNKNKVTFTDETDFMDAFYELELETGEVLSPLIYAQNEWKKKYSQTALFENIKRDGIRLL
jgi:predicted nucleotidyltransferase